MKIFLLSMLLWLGLGVSGVLAQGPSSTAFLNVNVVPMDRSRTLWNHTVIVQGSVITDLGPAATTRVPSDARKIEGHGTNFLLPGLADMHTHPLELDELPSYTANGITTILHMGQASDAFVADANMAIEREEAVGPRVFFSLMVDGSPNSLEGVVAVSSPEESRRAVEHAAANGYDFIKVYFKLSEPDFAAIVEEAQRLGLVVIGHGVRAVGLPKALYEGQVMVAHAEEFFYTAFENQRDATRIPEVVAAVVESGAFVTPTLSTIEVLAEQWGRPEVVDGYMEDPRARYLTPLMQQSWPARDFVTREGGVSLLAEFLHTFVAALHEAGVPLMTGTDSPVIPGAYPGFSLHHDLQTLVASGLSPYQALTAATRTPGEFIAKYVPSAQRFGMVEIGMRADLLMVVANPLSDIETLRTPLGVMSGGRWLSDVDLGAMMAEQAAEFRGMIE